jgi:hypothetical protein
MPSVQRDPEISLAWEAERFARYLIGSAPSRKSIQLYVGAASAKQPALDERDEKLLRFVHEHPWSLALLDSGLALLRPNAELRRRLHLMLAVLEATPEHCARFLPTERPAAYAGVIAATGVRAAVEAIGGALLVALLAL